MPRRPQSPRRHPERDLQAAIVELHSVLVARAADAILLAVPNGETRDERTALILTGVTTKTRAEMERFLPSDDLLRPHGQGVLPGAVDLMLLTTGPRTDTIEVKIPADRIYGQRAGKLSGRQERFRDAVVALGHHHHVVTCPEDYVRLLRRIGVRLRSQESF